MNFQKTRTHQPGRELQAVFYHSRQHTPISTAKESAPAYGLPHPHAAFTSNLEPFGLTGNVPAHSSLNPRVTRKRPFPIDLPTRRPAASKASTRHRPVRPANR